MEKIKFTIKPNHKKMTKEELEKYYDRVRKSHHVFEDRRKKKPKHKKKEYNDND